MKSSEGGGGTCDPHFSRPLRSLCQVSVEFSPIASWSEAEIYGGASAESLRRYPHLLNCAMAYSGMRHSELLALFRGELLRQLR